VVKTDIKAPKTVLSFSSATNQNGLWLFPLHSHPSPLCSLLWSAASDGEGETDDADEVERIVPFAGVVWTMRQAAYRGFTALYTVHVFSSLSLTLPSLVSPPRRNYKLFC
jgi:hypothetical protein